jgi:adenylate cyclase
VLAVVALAVLYTLVTVWSYQEYNLWLNWVYPVAGMLVTMSVSFMVRYRQEANRREQLRYAFGKYVSPVVVDALIQHPELLQLKGQRREVTILFCDIRGFTTLSETHDAEYVQQLLTRYFTTMNRIVLQEHRGIINKLIGDAIMAYWGFPLETDDHPYQAVSAALAMQEAIRNWPAEAGEPPITIGIGIHTGEVMVGNVGSEEFMDFTVIGDAVNLASRLEGVNKELGTTIVMSAATWERVKDRLPARSAGTVTVKGKTEAIDVYEPLPLGAAEVLAKLGAKRSE